MAIPKTVAHILEYEPVQRLITHLGTKTNSESTKKKYLYAIRTFCEFMGKDPDELLAERKEHLKSDDMSVQRKHEEMLMACFNEWDKVRSRALSRGIFVGVKSFYKVNYMDLKIETPKFHVSNADRIPTLEELKKMVDASESPLMKAAVLFSAQSGQRGGIVCSIRYGMVRRGLESGVSPLQIDISPEIRNSEGMRANKNRLRYSFFIGRDAIDALNTYLESRRSKGEMIDDESFLFVSENKFKDAFRPLRRYALNRLVRRAALGSGLIEKIEGRGPSTRYPIHHHSLRKFWQTAMEQAGVSKAWYDFMMGHALSELDRAYSRPTDDQLRDAYARAEKYLSVSRVNTPDTDKLKYDILLEVMRQQALAIGLDPQRIVIQREEEAGERITIREEVKLLQTEVLKTLHSTKSGNGCYTHKTVSEEELADHLNDDWEFMQKLGNGTVLVKKLKL